MKRLPVCALCILLLVSLNACVKVTVEADISGYGDSPITITGLKDEPFEITPNELKEFKCTEKSATGKTEKAGSVTAVGPTLETFVNEYGYSLAEFSRVRFVASDGYIKGLTAATLEKHEIILAVANGEKPLTESEAPLRILPDGLDSEYWVRMVMRIEFYKQ